MKTAILFFLLSFIFSFPDKLFSQCLQYEVPLSQRIQKSSLIIEGEIISSYSLWNPSHTGIITLYTIDIYKILKAGEGFEQASIIIETRGGQVDNIMEKITPHIEMENGDYGIFFLNPSKNNPERFGLYAANQGVLTFSVIDRTASDIFHTYTDIEKSIYLPVENLTGKPFHSLKESIAAPMLRVEGINISLKPEITPAGTGDSISISGLGFGAVPGLKGAVLFSNADNGGKSQIKAAPSQILFWSDSLIRVQIPAKAGTGLVFVTNSLGITAPSQKVLSIPYAIQNISSKGFSYTPSLTAQDNDGGYTFMLSNSFAANPKALAALQRALKSWQCKMNVNFRLGDTTMIDTSAMDGINIIHFDRNKDDIPAGVLALTDTRWAGCINGSSWYCYEIDMTIDKNINWNYSTEPATLNYDFETAILHEFGHALQLGHTINPSGLMNYLITAGVTRRNLEANEINAVNFINEQSQKQSVCGQELYKPYFADDCVSGIETANTTIEPPIHIYPMPSSDGKIIISLSGIKTTSLEIINILGQTVFHVDEPIHDDLQLDLSYLTKGTYLVRINTPRQKISQQIVLN